MEQWFLWASIFLVGLWLLLVWYWRNYPNRMLVGAVGIILILTIWAMLAVCAEATEVNFWLEPQIIINKEKDLKRIDGGLAGSLTEHVGYFAFGQVVDGYSQAYGGLTGKFSCLEVGIGIGREDGQKEWRRAATLAANCGKFSGLVVFENGGSGSFHKVVATYAVTDRFKIGVQDEKFLGRGPRIEYALGKNATLGTALLRDSEAKTTNAVFSVNFSF